MAFICGQFPMAFGPMAREYIIVGNLGWTKLKERKRKALGGVTPTSQHLSTRPHLLEVSSQARCGGTCLTGKERGSM